MKPTPVGNTNIETPVGELADGDLEYLWSEMVRHRSQHNLVPLIRGEREPASPFERRILDVAREMTSRNLFVSYTLVS